MSEAVKEFMLELKKEPFILYNYDSVAEDIIKATQKEEEMLRKKYGLDLRIKADFRYSDEWKKRQYMGLNNYKIFFKLLDMPEGSGKDALIERHRKHRELTGMNFGEFSSSVAKSLRERFRNFRFSDSNLHEMTTNAGNELESSVMVSNKPHTNIHYFWFTLDGRLQVTSRDFQNISEYADVLDYVVYDVFKKEKKAEPEPKVGPGEHIVSEYGKRSEEAKIHDVQIDAITQTTETGPLVIAQMIKGVMNAKHSINYVGHLGIIHQRTFLDKAQEGVNINIVTVGKESTHDQRKSEEEWKMLQNLDEFKNVTVKIMPGNILHGRYLSVDGKIAFGGSADLNADSQQRCEMGCIIKDEKTVKELDNTYFKYHLDNSNFPSYGKKK